MKYLILPDAAKKQSNIEKHIEFIRYKNNAIIFFIYKEDRGKKI